MFKNESEKCAENVVSKDADGVDALTKTNWSLQAYKSLLYIPMFW